MRFQVAVRGAIVLAVCGVVNVGHLSAQEQPEISRQTRMEIVRAFTTELIYVRTVFPMGKVGLKLRDGAISPSGPELQSLLAMWGPSVKVGDQARISNIEFKGNVLHVEINGGPVRKSKWYQHISVSGANGADHPIAPTDASSNPRGSFVDVIFDKHVPEMDAKQFKEVLRPVFDFEAKSAEEAYLDTMPPKIKAAIENHQVLVGMDREMVIHSKGRAPKKVREKDGDTEYEDWIYGEPPQTVDFVRVVGDEVVRVETMRVSGEKTIRTAREVDAPVRKDEKQNNAEKPAAPSLRRPGEEVPGDARRAPGVDPTPVPNDHPPNLLTKLYEDCRQPEWCAN